MWTSLLEPRLLQDAVKCTGARSSLGFPATVTRPGLFGCLNWRWLPRVATRYHPSWFNIRRTSLTFTQAEYQRGQWVAKSARSCSLTVELSAAAAWAWHFIPHACAPAIC